jgi:hypothetical protein
MNRLKKVRLKIERAEKHIEDLDGRIEIFRKAEPYTIGAKAHPVAEIKHTTLFISKVDPVPNDFALIAGDAIHNLRSSLDHLAWQLVETGGGSPNRYTYFPICRTPQQYASAMGKGEIKSMSLRAQKALWAIQPFITSDDTLLQVHDLDIVDKHRLVLTVATFVDGWIAVSNGRDLLFSQTPRPLIAGDEFTHIPTARYESTGHQNFKLGIDIAFGQSEILEGESVLATLKKMLDFVGGVVDAFQGFLI